MISSISVYSAGAARRSTRCCVCRRCSPFDILGKHLRGVIRSEALGVDCFSQGCYFFVEGYDLPDFKKKGAMTHHQ